MTRAIVARGEAPTSTIVSISSSFAPDCRAYLFHDGHGHTVAALWKFREEMDRGSMPGVNAVLKLGNIKAEFIDMMGNSLPVKHGSGKHTLPLSNFPLFIRVRSADSAVLEKAIEQAEAGVPLLLMPGNGKKIQRLDVVGRNFFCAQGKVFGPHGIVLVQEQIGELHQCIHVVGVVLQMLHELHDGRRRVSRDARGAAGCSLASGRLRGMDDQ